MAGPDAKNYTIGAMPDDVGYRYLETQGFPGLVISAESIDNFNKLLAEGGVRKIMGDNP